MDKQLWFNSFKHNSLHIIQFKSASNKEIVHEIKINDENYVRTLMTKINQLPTHGDMMKKIGPDADYTTLEFSGPDKTETIEFYNNSIKTPGTSFFSKTDENQKEIWDQIIIHFKKPEYGKPVPYIKNIEYTFNDFKIKYLGSEDKTPKGTTASSYATNFLVTNLKDKTIQSVVVYSGQLPPRPVEFNIENKIFILNTFSDNEFKRLLPLNFLIRQK